MNVKVRQRRPVRARRPDGETPAGTAPFGEAVFLAAWWRHFGDGRVRVEGMPGFGLRWGGRLVEGVGVGAGDFLDVPGLTPGALARWWEAHAPAAGLFPRLTDETALAAALKALAAERHLPLHRIPFEPAPYVDLTGSWEAFLARKSSRTRATLRRKRRRLEALGPVTFRHVTTPDGLDDALDAAFALYRRRAQTAYRGPLWLEPRGQAFLRDWAHALAREGRLDLTFLSAGERPLAFCFGFHNGQDYFHYGVAFDPDPAVARHSPGTLLLMHILERAFAAGYRRYDFLAGDEPYKREWATGSRMVYAAVMGAGTPVGRAAAAVLAAALRGRQALRQGPLRPVLDAFRQAGSTRPEASPKPTQ